MPVITNLNTSQSPMASSGLTGAQVIRFINAPRVYIKDMDVTPEPPATKSNGTVPDGWTDLGIINGNARLTYEKELKEIRTGLDNVLRAQYIGQKSATLEFTLAQFDDVVMTHLTGLTASQIVSGSAYAFPVGSEDIVTKALLLVMQNKLDGKEWQFYNPAAQISFAIAEDGEATVVNVTASLTAFLYQGKDALIAQTIFA